MAFRELRSFTETMRALGYPRLISMENFRLPNFELVADCLYWLVQRYYPGVDIEDEISTEADRVRFLQSVAQVMLTKARMKLNIKKLYSADGNAVRELLKVAALLYKATEKAAVEEEDTHDAMDFSAMMKGFNPKDIKGYAAEIIKAGATLYDGLGQEADMRDYRARAIAGHVDTEFVERSVQEAINQVEDHIRSLEQQLDELERNEKTLDNKIEKKKQELERSEKRLSTLQSVRPAYMDEYERLQGELNSLYGLYVDKFRNLEFLEHELESYYQAEQAKLEAQEKRLKKMQKRLREEELRILRGEQEVNENNLDAGFSDDDDDDDDVELSGDDDDDLSDSLDQAPRGAPPRQEHAKHTGQRPSNGFGNSLRGQQGMGGGGNVMGTLNGDFDDGSIDEDDNSDGGEVSMAGSEQGGRQGIPAGGGGGYGGGGGGGYGGGGGGYGDADGILDDEEDDDF